MQVLFHWETILEGEMFSSGSSAGSKETLIDVSSGRLDAEAWAEHSELPYTGQFLFDSPRVGSDNANFY